MLNRTTILALSFLLIVGSRVYAQPYYFRHYQVENGLSNNAVICSLQDKKGFLWFGTKDGLNRFDGYTFKIFRHDPADSGSIGSNFIHALYEDAQGIMWIGTEKGLYRYNALSESFNAISATRPFQISEIIADSSGNLWFIAGLTLHRYSIARNRLDTYNPGTYFEAAGLCTTPDGNVWISTSRGLLEKYQPETNSFNSFDVFDHSPLSAFRWIEKIQSINQYLILVGTAMGLKIFDTRNQGYRDINLGNKGQTGLFVRDFLQTSPAEYWIGTEAGIFIYNSSTGQCTNLRKRYNDPFSLSDNAVYTFCRDREGGIWCGTYFGGINYYPYPYTPFKKWIPRIGENSLSGNVIREIKKDRNGNFWIGTEDAGLNKMDASGKFTHFLPSGEKGSISYSNIHGLLLTGDELWIGTFEHGLDVMNINTGKVMRHYMASGTTALKSNFIYCIYQTDTGDIYIGTSIGLYRYNPVKDDFDVVSGMPLYNWYTSILKDADGTLWTGTYGNGVNYLDTRTGKSSNLRYHPGDRNSLSSDRVNAIFEDSRKRLWFATEDGLCCWDRAARNFKRYSTTNGFPSNFIMSILEDAREQLWISTTRGLVCFHPETAKLQVFTIANGLLSDQFNFSSAYKDENGRMYFGSARGLTSFHPAEFSRNLFTPPVYITGFQINNKDIVIGQEGSPLKNAITFTSRITLAHNQSTFSIDFAALSFTAPETLEYAYAMSGLLPDWTYLKKNRKVYFTELGPGTYTFRIKATNSSGIWNGKETVLTIVILPPWWKSWWAYCVYACLFVLVAALLVRNYHNRVQEKARRNMELLEIAKEKEIYHAKMEFFTNVSHEIRTPLTLIKGPLDKVIRKAGGIPEIQGSLRIMERNTLRLLDLTNQLLDFRQTEINGFRLSFVQTNLCELLEDAYQSFTALAEQKNIRFSLQLPSERQEAYVDTDAFRKIIYNLLSNAIKYARSRAAMQLLPFSRSDSNFTILVQNDGYIIPTAMKEKIFEPFYRIRETEKQKGTGIGLALSRSLAELHKGVLECEAPEKDMNVFRLSLPVHQEIEFTLGGPAQPKDSLTEANFKE